MRNINWADRARFGPYEVDLRTRELWKHGTRLKLVGQPLDILEELIARPGELVSREELHAKLWPSETFVDFNHGLNAAVNKLRDALSDSADDPKYIETLPRRGYRFIATVEREPVVPASVEVPLPEIEQKGPISADTVSLAAPPLVATAAADSVPIPALVIPPDPTRDKKKSHPRRWLYGALALVGFFLLFHLIVYFFNRPSVVYYPVPVAKASRAVLLTGPDRYEGPRLSPDGTKLAFMSNRSGAMEIWLSQPDGSNPTQLTTVGGAGSPSWSPDGRTIVFDSQIHDIGSVLAVNVDGGPPRFIAIGKANNLVPSFSHDGRWIYFASDRSGTWQVWKVAVEGGTPKQVTAGGGFAALESPDGQFIYYAKTRLENPEIWRVSVAAGSEAPVSPLVRVGTWASWSITRQGIIFVDSSVQAAPVITLFDLNERKLKQLTIIDKFPFWFSVTEDGRTAVFDRSLPGENSIIRIEDFQ